MFSQHKFYSLFSAVLAGLGLFRLKSSFWVWNFQYFQYDGVGRICLWHQGMSVCVVCISCSEHLETVKTHNAISEVCNTPYFPEVNVTLLNLLYHSSL